MSLIKYKGFADIVVGLLLTTKPSVIYDSFLARRLSALTGLHLSNAEVAPGFNQAIACMVVAVGVGHVVAARCGPAARRPILAMDLTWGLLALAVCLTGAGTPRASATLLQSGISHTLFGVAVWYTES
ncbi:hypothetical protein BD779DRAFT_1569952 [Infundibulicybe gibba]|nr:hypothetical protein BD779DRAFT_1569952 [Infundibulicybe gibba]